MERKPNGESVALVHLNPRSFEPDHLNARTHTYNGQMIWKNFKKFNSKNSLIFPIFEFLSIEAMEKLLFLNAILLSYTYVIIRTNSSRNGSTRRQALV